MYAASSCRYRVKPVPNMCCVASNVGSSKVMSRNLYTTKHLPVSRIAHTRMKKNSPS